MYTQPDLTSTVERLAHILSEMHNDSAPIGWERYRTLASLLLLKLPIKETVDDPRFLDPMFQAGKESS
jgi:hypothetical protein